MSANNELWAKALEEAENCETREAGMWARCFAEAGGDEGRAKAAYTKMRVEQELAKPVYVQVDFGVCPSCGTECRMDAKKCPKCGVGFAGEWSPEYLRTESVEKSAIPPSVQADNPVVGRKLASVAAQANREARTSRDDSPGIQLVKTQKSRGVYIIFALFFGLLGIHNFYAGRYARGVMQMLITVILGWFVVGLVISGIWALIDCFSVSTDGDGHPMS